MDGKPTVEVAAQEMPETPEPRETARTPETLQTPWTPEMTVSASSLDDAGTQETLARIWAEVLKVERVGPDDDFFALGGESLVALELLSQVAGELAVQLPFVSIFEYPTVRRMAQAVRLGREAASDGAREGETEAGVL